MASDEGKKITLKSSDGEEFVVDEAVAMLSQTIRHMIEDDCAETGIPLPNVNSKILVKVIEYCKKHVEAAPPGEDKAIEQELRTWDADFVKVDQATLFDLILEKDARPTFPSTYAATGAKRGGYNNLEKEKQEVCEWSAILDEADELAGLHGKACNSFNPSVVPEERRNHKGGRGNSRFKFSFRSLSNKEDLSRDHSSKDETYNSCEEEIEGPVEWDYFEHGTEEDTVPQLMESILEESVQLDNKPGFHKQLVGAPSVSELLEDMQKADPSLRRTMVVDNIKGKARQKSSSKRTLLHLGNRVLDNKDAPEFIGDISSEDEHIDQDYQVVQIVKGQTMADLFQEVFNTSAEERAEIPISNKLGFHGRLQHVIQIEKSRHMEHLKELQTGSTPSNESNRIIVRILSKTLEAKLTVCQCLFGENTISFHCEKGLHEGFGKGGSMKKTIVFTPTFCSNVELEVGSIVCIDPPWKEFQVNGGETIILCTHFSSSL